MADSIQWVDSEGAASLSNGKPDPATRFGNWTPSRRPVGPAVTAPGTGRLHRFEFRRDDIIRFEIAAIPGTEANLDLCTRLEYHLLNGGLVTPTTDRPLASRFATCTLAEGFSPELDFSDRQLGEYTFSVTLRGGDASDTDLFYPAFIPGLKLWLDASTITGKNDGDSVSTWLDLSGNSNHAVQATGTKQPTYRTESFGTLPSLEFDQPNGDFLATPDILAPGVGATFFMVAYRWGTPYEHGNYMGWNSSDARIYSRDNGGSTELRWPGPTTIGTGVDSPFLIALSFASYTSITPYFNTLTAGTPFSATTWINSVRPVYVGSESGAGTGNNRLAEILLYNSAITTANRNRIINYLATKWGVTLV